MSLIRVILVDQNSVFRAGLKLELEDGKDIIVIAQHGDVEDAIVSVSGEQPDLIVLESPPENRPLVDTIDKILLASAETRILLLTNDHREETRGAAILAGSHGVMSKGQQAGTLRMAVKQVHNGEAWTDRKHTNDHLDGRQKIAQLTAKELEITKLIALGMVNKAIGNHLDISEKTVRNHLTVIYSKLGVSNRLELAIFASNNGLKPTNMAE